MKTKRFKPTSIRVILSAFVIIIFALIAVGSFTYLTDNGVAVSIIDNGDGTITKQYVELETGNVEEWEGYRDKYGRWQGPIKITYFNLQDGEDKNYFYEEVVEMVDHKRHGISEIKYLEEDLVYRCYDMGVRVDCDKSAFNTQDNSAFEILSYNNPFFVSKLGHSGFDEEYVEAYLDTLESLVLSKGENLEDFGDYYRESVDSLELTPYDSIIQYNAIRSYITGADFMNDDEFRYAVLDQQYTQQTSTYDIVNRKYPNYLAFLNLVEVSNNEFNIFCTEFDNIMNSFPQLDKEDPLFVDSVDMRIYNTIGLIQDTAAPEGKISMILEELPVDNAYKAIKACSKYLKSYALASSHNQTLQKVATIVTAVIMIKIVDGELIKSSVKKSFINNKGIVILPLLTTEFLNEEGSSSVMLKGNVTKDGGAEITERGIVWAEYYNPEKEANIISGGSGTGSFEIMIDGLEEGTTYYARTYASNSAGTAYGNTISFDLNGSAGIVGIIPEGALPKLYPNPVVSELFLDINLQQYRNPEIFIIDTKGCILVHKKTINQENGKGRIRLDLSNIENGIYFCRINEGKHLIFTEKIIVIR